MRLDHPDVATGELESGNRAIVPGRPDASELLRRVSADEFERMPPEGEPLDEEQIATLRAWIAAGAPWPEHWAYRPLDKPILPELDDAKPITPARAWLRSPIDRFLLRGLTDAGLQPSNEADRRTLIRRLTFDLHGLPPTPAEIEAFLTDESPDAYEQLVDRLLASPRYGERWARRWMDIVHYADSHGFEHDVPRDIWPYRDYLVDSFNLDRPYAEFVRQQIAGDALYPGDAAALEATGFLATGPWDLSAQQAGNADSIDRIISQYQDRDDVVSTVISTFVSSTAHCARCHDHKFDPISQQDYYALQAVFAGIDKAHRPYDPDPAIALQRRELETRLADIRRMRESADIALLSPEMQVEAALFEQAIRESRPEWRLLNIADARSANGSELIAQDDGSLLASGERPERDTYSVVVHSQMPLITAFRIELLTDDSLPHQGPGRQENGNLHLNELLVTAAPLDDPAAVQSVPLINPLADFNQEGWSVDRALDGNAATAWGIYPQVGRPHAAVFQLAEPLKADSTLVLTFELQQTHGQGHLIGRFRLSAAAHAPPFSVDSASMPADVAAAIEIEPAARTPEQTMLVTGYVLEQGLQSRLQSLPPQQMLYCGTNQFEGKGGFQPAASPRSVHLLIRGDVGNPGPVAEPATLQLLEALPGTFSLPDPDDEAARRAALAEWLVDPHNVLTWRSIVNRVWQFRFGSGLVDTPNDFGRMGSAPTHPELLDWLAITFRDGGGSIKSLDRMLVTTAAYRQSSQADPLASLVDADNRLLWRMNRRRLDGESVRDSVLHIADRLDSGMGGPPVKHFIETRTFGLRAEADYQNFDVDDPAQQRRSVYRFIYRTFPDPFLSALDCPDGTQLTPERNVSVTSLQALATLNDKFVIRQCEHLAARLSGLHPDLPSQVDAAFQLILSRSPEPQEQALVTAYADRHGLANACRFLLNTNEFMFID